MANASGPRVACLDGVMGGGRTGIGPLPGARSRSPIVCSLITPDDPEHANLPWAIYQALYIKDRGSLRRALHMPQNRESAAHASLRAQARGKQFSD